MHNVIGLPDKCVKGDEKNKVVFMGTSMLPTLKSGYKIKVIPVTQREVAIGDIVLLKRDEVICHRIVGRFRKDGQLFFLEKGDNRDKSFIRSIIAEKIMGKVVEISTSEGEILDAKMFNKTISKIKYWVFNLIYNIGYQIEMMLFGRKQNSFIKRFNLKVATVCNYLI